MPDQPKIQFVPVENLKLDPENPRLPSNVDGNDEKEVLKWMLEEGNGNLPELMGSIGQQGFFPGEPLLVTQNRRQKDQYIVVEGNRRLAAVKLLKNPSLATAYQKTVRTISEGARFKPDVLPVFIYPKRSEILDYLGYRHVTGVKTWSSLAKAKYLKQLYDLSTEADIPKRYQTLAKSIGSRANTIAKLLTGLEIYNRIKDRRFFGIKGLEEDEIDFSLLTTALGYENIINYVGLESATDITLNGIDDARLKKLTGWIFEKNSEGRTRLGESRNLKALDAVVGSDQALEEFDTNAVPLLDAALFTGYPLETFRHSVLESKKHLQIAQDSIRRIEREMKQSDEKILGDIETMARDLRTLVKNRYPVEQPSA
jgi:hypothetical protein